MLLWMMKSPSECIAPLDDIDVEIRHAEHALEQLRRRQGELQASLWRAYKPTYEQHLGGEDDE